MLTLGVCVIQWCKCVCDGRSDSVMRKCGGLKGFKGWDQIHPWELTKYRQQIESHTYYFNICRQPSVADGWHPNTRAHICTHTQCIKRIEISLLHQRKQRQQLFVTVRSVIIQRGDEMLLTHSESHRQELNRTGALIRFVETLYLLIGWSEWFSICDATVSKHSFFLNLSAHEQYGIIALF